MIENAQVQILGDRDYLCIVGKTNIGTVPEKMTV